MGCEVKNTWWPHVKDALVWQGGAGVLWGHQNTTTMKVRYILFFLCALAQQAALPQLEHKSYELTSDLVLTECDSKGVAKTAAALPAGESPDKYCSEGWRFVVLEAIDQDNYVLSFFDWYSDTELAANAKERSWFLGSITMDAGAKSMAELYNYDMSRPKGLRERFFRITKDQLMNAAIPLPQRFAPIFGAIVLPFKYRPQTGLLSKDLALGAVGGVQFRSRSNTSAALVFGATLSSVTLDSASTDFNVKERTERAALSVPLGLLLQWDKLQVGLLTGWDFLFDGNPDKWCYQGKPWLSLGVGIAVFTAEGNGKETKQ